MNAYRARYVLSVLVSVGSLSSVACDTEPSYSPSAGAPNNVPVAGTPPVGVAGTPGTATGGTGGAPDLTGGTGGGDPAPGAGAPSSGGDPTKVVAVPDETGWIDYDAPWNTIGVQGAWYPYGDQYGAATCTDPTKGNHPAAECSVITTPPPPPATGFPNTDGKMCTTGTVAMAKCTSCTETDWSNIWGAGIGIDLASPGGETTTKKAFPALDSGVVGVSFTYTPGAVKAGLRVEFPMNETEGHADGSNYWKAGSSFPASIPKSSEGGDFTILWSDMLIKQPGTATAEKPHVAFDPNKITGIQFHVFAAEKATTPYDFCISNLTFIVDPALVKKAPSPGKAEGGGGAPGATGGAPGTETAGTGGTGDTAGAPGTAGAASGGTGDTASGGTSGI